MLALYSFELNQEPHFSFVNFAVAPTTNRRGAVMTCPIPDPTPPTSPLPTWEPLSLPPGGLIDGGYLALVY